MGIIASPENPYRVEVHEDKSAVVSPIFSMAALNSMFIELPLSTRTLATIMLAIWLSITRGSWWGKWTVRASSSENEMT